MGKKLKETELQRYWVGEIERAEKCKEAWRKKFQVEACYKYFLGDQRPENYAAEDWFTLNLVYSNIHAQIPSLYFKDPYFFVRLKRSYIPDQQYIELVELNMRVREGVLNYLQGENDLVSKGQLCILDAFFQFGVLKARYVSKFERNPDGGRGAPKETLVAEKFKWERVNPNNILVSADAGCEEFTWIAQKCVDYYENVKNNPLYEGNTAKLESDANLKDYDEDASNSDGFLPKLGGKSRKKFMGDTPDSEKLVTFWEIYDISRNLMWVVASNNDRPLLKRSMPKGIDGHPFSFLRFNDNTDENGEESWYPIPEVFNQLGAQAEYNLACNDVALHRKRFKRKYGVYEGCIDEEELEKLEDPIDGQVVKMAHPDWQTKFAAIEDPPLNNAVYYDRTQLRVDFYDMAGAGPDSAVAGKSDTATEAEILNNRLQIRESDKQYRIRKFLIHGARKIHQLLEAQLTTEGAVHVVGPRGKGWIQYNNKSFGKIEGEIEFDIDVASMAPRNIQTERAQLLQFFQTIMQAPMIFTDPKIMEYLAEKFDIHEEGFMKALTERMVEMTQMAQQQEGLLSNMPGGNSPVAGIGDTLRALQGGG